MGRFELKDSPCTRCRRDESGHEMNWKNRDKTQRSGLCEDAGELCRRAGRMQKAGKERVR